MNALTALVSFAAIIVVAVFVHECGHYLTARLFKVRVLRFSVGFGKPLWKKEDKHGTEWVLAPILFGGYVQMLDLETARRAGLPESESLEGKSNWERFIVFAAGPFANIVLSAFLAALLALGGEIGLKPTVGKVAEGGAAANAGLRRGDEIAAVNGEETVLWRQAAELMTDAILGEEEMVLQLRNGGRRVFAPGTVGVGAIDGGVFSALGMFPDDGYLSPEISLVVAGSAAERAGVRAGDVVVVVGETVIDGWSDLRTAVAARPNEETAVVVWRDGEEIRLTAVIGERIRGGRRAGVLGVSPVFLPEKLAQMRATLHLGFFAAMAAGARRSGEYVARTFSVLGHIIKGDISPDNLSGPIGIAAAAGTAAEDGFLQWLQFLAFISASLAAINLLPLPLLDGGQMVVCIMQAARRKPFSPAFLAALGRAGGAFLLALMLFVIVNDMLKLWG